MNEQKKQWQKPVLIIIGRGKPEENVLAACKINTETVLGPNGKTCADNNAGPCLSSSVS
jgi:hypothetical protein